LQNGLYPVSIPDHQLLYQQAPHYVDRTSSSRLPQKRKLSATDIEIPNSDGEDDEDYDWGAEDEEALPEMPPQWQGSEDILVPAADERELEDEEEADVNGAFDVKEDETSQIDDSEDELAL